jgi:AcrR family transcriptional regulator
MARKKEIPDRTDRIVASARKLFGYYGYEKTTLDQIAQDIGISKGSIYLDFAGKDDILMAVIQDFIASQVDRMQELYKDPAIPPLEALKHMLLDHVTTVFTEATRQAHSTEAMAITSMRVRSEFRAYFTQIELLIAGALMDAAKAGDIQPQAHYQTTAQRILLGMSAFFPPYFKLAEPDGGPLQQGHLLNEASAVLDIILNGLKVPVEKKKGS